METVCGVPDQLYERGPLHSHPLCVGLVYLFSDLGPLLMDGAPGEDPCSPGGGAGQQVHAKHQGKL